MERWIVLLLVYLAHDVVFAKPGFDKFHSRAVNSYWYYNELHREYHLSNGAEFVQKQKAKTSKLNTNVAKNAILFLGDGMSVPTLAATRVYIGGEEQSLSFEKFPYVAMSKTYCVDKQVADSACTATGNYNGNVQRFAKIFQRYEKAFNFLAFVFRSLAYLTGVKANYGTIGVSAKVPRKHCQAGNNKAYHTQSIAQWALDAGKSIGLVTTTRGILFLCC